MTTNKARRIAENWQTGPFSALAEFAKTGNIEKTRIREEIAKAAKEARKLEHNEALLEELADLRYFIEK